MARRRALVVLVGALLAGCAGCGDDTGKVQTVTVTGTEMRFTPGELTLAPGRYRFHFVNAGTVYHDLGFYRDGRSLGTREAAAGRSSDLAVIELGTGTYTMECREPGHLQAGMHGTLSVRKAS